MFVIGLVGGVASGKSLVARQFQRCGAEVLDADRAGHAVLEQSDVRAFIRDRWGAAVFNSQDRVDRPALAKIVFAPPPEGPRELNYLEQITHPRIKIVLQQQMQELSARGVAMVVLDAPVLFKAGWQDLCDLIVFVEAPQQVRQSRAAKRGWSAAQFAEREAAQELLTWKRSQAGAIIDNSGTPEATAAQVEQLCQQFQTPEARPS